MDRIWFDKPAKRWEEALPLGNGRIGAMAHGATAFEHFQLNEDTCWFGGWRDRNNPDAKRALPIVREMLLNGKIHDAEQLMVQAFSGMPQSQHPYQKLGDLKLYMSHGDAPYEKYIRELDLSSAIYRCSYSVKGVNYEREAFISAPDDVLAVHIKADCPAAVCFSANIGRDCYDCQTLQTGGLSEWAMADTEVQKANGILCLGSLGEDSNRYGFEIRITTVGGYVERIGDNLNVKYADEATLLLTAGTSFRMKDIPHELSLIFDKAFAFDYDKLKQRHISDYRKFYDRVELHLGDDNQQDDIPTDVRLSSLTCESEDTVPDKLYFNFGRYLMISGSRPGSMPLNLQGIWCKDYDSAWQSKYTININTEMNYWPAECCNLPEMHMPLFDLINRMVPNGRRTAEKMYGCRGWVAHHNTDLWGDTAVQDHWIPGSYWVMGAAWLCTHQWKHYLYTADKDFLRESFPIMREAAEFFLDFLIEYKGYLVTCPSVSPENTYILPSGEQGANSIGTTMDNQILHDLFSQCIKAAEVLGVDDELNERIKAALSRLVPIRIGKYGQIMEWIEDYDEVEPGHRHISQLYGLHPSDMITPDETPELAEAAGQTLKRRLSFGGGHTGWSRAWIINNYARLFDGEEAFKNFRLLLIKSTLPNMFDNHPPFQIDGNFGGICGIVQMLVQSNERRTVLLPALPSKWPTGSVRGIKLVGGCTLDMEWENGRLRDYSIHSERACKIKIVYCNASTDYFLNENDNITIKL